MTVNLKIPFPLRESVGGQDSIDSNPGKLIDILRDIGDDYPDFKEKIFNEYYILKSYILLLLDDKVLRNTEIKDIVVKDDQTVRLILAIGGG